MKKLIIASFLLASTVRADVVGPVNCFPESFSEDKTSIVAVTCRVVDDTVGVFDIRVSSGILSIRMDANGAILATDQSAIRSYVSMVYKQTVAAMRDESAAAQLAASQEMTRREKAKFIIDTEALK